MKGMLVLLTALSLYRQRTGVAVHEESLYAKGAVHREIADSSPVAQELITLTKPTPRDKSKYPVIIQIINITDHPLTYVEPQQFLEVRNNKTGKLAPETIQGCASNFFDDCYQPYFPFGAGVPYGGPPKDVISPHASITLKPMDFIDRFYILTPGEYTVDGIFCATQREGPECFRSNKIILNVP